MRQSQPNKTRYNPDLAWLINESGGALGEKGQSFDPTNMGGGGDPSNNWPAIERMHAAQPSVRRWRRLNSAFVLLTGEQRAHLRHRYRDLERQHTEVPGLRSAFGDLAGLAWHLCADREEMRRLLSDSSKGKKKIASTAVLELLQRSERLNREAHQAFLDAQMDVVMGSKFEQYEASYATEYE